MKLNTPLCAVIVSFAVAGASALHAQTDVPAASPAASLAADPSSAAASPTPLAIVPASATPVITKKHDRAANPKMLEKYDTNKNGQIDSEEKTAMKKDRAARHEERLKKYDKNGDGRLDDTEKAAMKAETKADKKSGKTL